jgi:meso-butanediol dehydrogenase / (S,S)-butanediol dehydrogenase / diacetyl reductase
MERTAIETGARLAGKRVLITGTGRGQGAAAQELFCRHGATVWGCDVVAGAAEASAEELRSKGLSASGMTVDLADVSAAKRWVDAAVAELGGLDVLYNNASKPVFQLFGEMTFEQWRSTMVNELDLIFTVTQPAWRHLSGGGSIINTGSMSAHQGFAGGGSAAHGAAKGAIVALTRHLAAEGAQVGIRANSISPGFVLTPGTDAAPADYRNWLINSVQMIHRPADPGEVAMLALYLASDESSFVTGSDFRIDAGATTGRT